MTYTVVLRPEPEGEFTVIVPALPGCFSRGRTVMQCVRNAQEAIECYLESMAQHGEEFPVEGRDSALPTAGSRNAFIHSVSVH